MIRVEGIENGLIAVRGDIETNLPAQAMNYLAFSDGSILRIGYADGSHDMSFIATGPQSNAYVATVESRRVVEGDNTLASDKATIDSMSPINTMVVGTAFIQRKS